MINEELKKKLVEIIINAIWKDAQADYDNTDESEARTIADALIAAGIGDLKGHRVFVGKDGSIKYLYSGEEVEKIAKERKELKDELRSKVEYIQEQDGIIQEYKHRAEVAERALKSRALCHVLQYLSCEPDILKSCIQEVYEEWIYQAEKQLEEERKDENI